MGWGYLCAFSRECVYTILHVVLKQERERELWNASEMCLLCFTLDLEGFRLLPVPVFWGVHVLFEEKIVGALVFRGLKDEMLYAMLIFERD